MKKRIITLPIKAYKKEKIGLLVLPIFAETLKKKTGSEAILALNLSDSFEDRYEYIENYYNLIKDTNIKLDSVWIDTNNKENLLKELDKLVEVNAIKEKNKNVKVCKCGKVEIDEELAEKINGKCYRNENGQLYCNSCNEKIISKVEKCLVFESKKDIGMNILAVPGRVSKQIKELDKKIGGNDIIISRKRDTGYKYEFNGNSYNIDIDFMWQNYLATFDDEETEKIIVGSNHTIYAMYMINMIDRYKGNNPSIFLALPHVKGLEDIEFKKLDEKAKKMTMAFATSKMKKPDSNWDQNMYEYLEKLPEADKKKFEDKFDRKIDIKEQEDTVSYLNRIVTQEINFQTIVRKLKAEKEEER